MLDDFLETVAATPFVDGSADCALTGADWVIAATGCVDPAAHLRGRYSTAIQRERLLRRLGGLEAVMTDCAARAGLSEVANPVRGDVGLIRFERARSSPERPRRLILAGICLGQRWAMKSSAGLTVGSPDLVMKVWRVPHG